MTCRAIPFSYPFIGIAQRALIARMTNCAIFMISHVSLNVIRLIEERAKSRDAHYLIIYSKLTGALTQPIKLEHGLLIRANHHEKYYLVDGRIFAAGTANLTDTEFNDQTLNRLTIHACSTPNDLDSLNEFNIFKRELRIILRSLSDSMYQDVKKLLGKTLCGMLLV